MAGSRRGEHSHTHRLWSTGRTTGWPGSQAGARPPRPTTAPPTSKPFNPLTAPPANTLRQGAKPQHSALLALKANRRASASREAPRCLHITLRYFFFYEAGRPKQHVARHGSLARRGTARGTPLPRTDLNPARALRENTSIPATKPTHASRWCFRARLRSTLPAAHTPSQPAFQRRHLPLSQVNKTCNSNASLVPTRTLRLISTTPAATSSRRHYSTPSLTPRISHSFACWPTTPHSCLHCITQSCRRHAAHTCSTVPSTGPACVAEAGSGQSSYVLYSTITCGRQMSEVTSWRVEVT